MTIVAIPAMIRSVIVAISIVIVAMSIATMAIAQDWRALDPENTLLIDTTKGRIIVEMRPELAPKAVERIKLLARERVYDGLQFHRVIAGFVAQTGNPNNKDGGVSRHPDLEPEFTFRLAGGSQTSIFYAPDPVNPELMTSFDAPFEEVSESEDLTHGLAGATPIAGEVVFDPGKRALQFRGWGAYCTGVAGMGRQADPGSANSEIFFMLEPERRLDHDYTVWGRIVVGQDVLSSLAVGEPPASPDLMTEVRVASELREEMRPIVEIEDGPALRRRIDNARAEKGADFSVCDVIPDARILG